MIRFEREYRTLLTRVIRRAEKRRVEFWSRTLITRNVTAANTNVGSISVITRPLLSTVRLSLSRPGSERLAKRAHAIRTRIKASVKRGVLRPREIAARAIS